MATAGTIAWSMTGHQRMENERVETGKDTQLLGFYAVNKTTGEVISGEKTSWSEVGSEAYREATGE